MASKQRVRVTTYMVKLICDCGGEMLPTGIMLASLPPRYPHQCQNCGITTTVPTRTYPAIDYEETDERTGD